MNNNASSFSALFAADNIPQTDRSYTYTVLKFDNDKNADK